MIITRHGKQVARLIPEAEMDRERVQRAIDGMRALRQRIGKASVEEILSMARLYRLSFYDAVYLAAAQRNRDPLATLDKDLRNAAFAAGIPLLA